jgi:flagellar motor switch protein FliG
MPRRIDNLLAVEWKVQMTNRQATTRKAAILIASLDPATADALLAQMSPEQADALRDAVRELGHFDADEQETVVDEFFRIGPMLPECQPAGIDLESRLAERIGGPFTLDEPPQSAIKSPRNRSFQPPFRFLHAAAGTKLATRLQQEHPQTIAVVVSHLPPESGADLLGGLPPSLQAEVARRLVDLEETDPEILLEIEQGLETWLNEYERSSRRRTAGMMALQSILAAADPFAHETLLANLARHDRRLANQLTAQDGRSYAFADLHELDDLSLGKVFVQAEHDVLALALAGAGKALIARAYRVLPVARAARLRRDLDCLGPRRVSDVEAAQQEVADVASDLDRRNRLTGATGRKLSVAI